MYKYIKTDDHIIIIIIMSYVGKLEQKDLKDHIIPAYDNFDNMDYDITIAKTILKDFIVKYCATQSVPSPPNDIQKYNMSTYGINGMYVKIKENENIMYLFDIETGNTYVSEFEYNIMRFNNNLPFDILVMIHQDSASLTYRKVVLLS